MYLITDQSACSLVSLKFLEKLVYNRFYSFLEKSNAINEHQFGFRKKHSTSHLTSLLTANIATSFENKMNTFGIFLDLSKAFDLLTTKYCLINFIIMESEKRYIIGSKAT